MSTPFNMKLTIYVCHNSNETKQRTLHNIEVCHRMTYHKQAHFLDYGYQSTYKAVTSVQASAVRANFLNKKYIKNNLIFRD